MLQCLFIGVSKIFDFVRLLFDPPPAPPPADTCSEFWTENRPSSDITRVFGQPGNEVGCHDAHGSQSLPVCGSSISCCSSGSVQGKGALSKEKSFFQIASQSFASHVLRPFLIALSRSVRALPPRGAVSFGVAGDTADLAGDCTLHHFFSVHSLRDLTVLLRCLGDVRACGSLLHFARRLQSCCQRSRNRSSDTHTLHWRHARVQLPSIFVVLLASKF